ncbi:MAG TPA: hypothetical protein VN931_01380 [Fibrobacteria bacterium]|nr:hypothetical protein [Fibrobacteria bacterium]
MKVNRIAIALVLAGLWSCKKDEEAAPPPPPSKPKDFAPPADGLLAADRAARWRQADSLVRDLDSIFQDSLRAHPDRAAQLAVEQDAARDIASRKAGLLGWKEYRWILEDAPLNPANTAAFQAAGLSMATPDQDAVKSGSKRNGKPRPDRM